MADEKPTTTSADLATREQAKKEQAGVNPVPLTLTIQYDPKKSPPPPGEPEAQAAGGELAPGGEGAAPAPTGEAAPQAPEQAAAPAPQEDQARLSANDAKSAFELLLKQFGITQPLGEKGILEQAIGSPGQTTGDVADLVRRVARGLDLGLQVMAAPAVGAGTLAKEVVERAAPLPYQAAAAVGAPVPESLLKPKETGASRAIQHFTQALAGLAVGPGAVIGPAAKGGAKAAAESGRSLALKGEFRAAMGEERGAIGPPAPPPKPPRRAPTLRPATKEEAEAMQREDASSLAVGNKLLSIQWGEMADNQAIQNTVKKLRDLYVEKRVIPMEETRRLADQLRDAGFEDRVLQKALLDGKTRAEAQALVDLSKKGIERTNELRETLRLLQPGTPEYQRTFQEFQVQIGITGKFVTSLDDMLGEAGGTLRIGQEAAQKIGSAKMDWMRDYAEKVSKGIIRDVDALPELWDALPRPEQKWQFTRLASKHAWDILRELAYDSMLFTFKGNVANIMGSMFHLKRPVDLTLATGIGTLRNAFWKTLGKDSPTALPLSQAAASGQGMIAALTEAHWVAWDTFLTGESRFGNQFKSVQRAISGDRFAETLAAKNIQLADPVSRSIDQLGFTLGLGNRALAGADEFFKLVQYSARSFELAFEEAARQGVPAEEVNAFVRNYLRFMPDDAKRVAVAHAHYATFTEPMSGTLKWMSQAADSPALVGFIPFFPTLANVVRVGFEHLPGLNFLVKRSRQAIFAGGTDFDLAMAKVSEGTALAIMGSWLYDNGRLTGRGPENKAIKQVQKDMGWQEDAWAFYNDRGEPTGYLGLNRLDPANQAFLLVARTRDLMQDMGADSVSIDTRNELAVGLALALGEYTQNISFMRGVKDALEVVTSGTVREAETRRDYLARRAASLTVPSGIGQINTVRDPYMREAETYSDQVCSRTPWCSTGLYPQRKLNGEPRLRLEAIGPKWLEFASPLPYSAARPDPVSSTIVENDMGVSFPSKVIMGPKPATLKPRNVAKEGIRLTDAQYDLYQRLAGNELKIPAQDLEGIIKALGYEGPSPAGGKYGMWDILTALVQTDFYKNQLTAGTGGGKEKLVLGIMSHFRTAAVGEMVLHEQELLGAKYDPEHDFRNQYIEKKLATAEAVGGKGVREQAERALKTMPGNIVGPKYGNPERRGTLPPTMGQLPATLSR